MDNIPTYRSLDEIRLRKAQLMADIRKDENHISKQWNRLVHPKKQSRQTASSRLSTIVSTGAGVFDAALLGWKLYRRFGGKPNFMLKRKGKKK